MSSQPILQQPSAVPFSTWFRKALDEKLPGETVDSFAQKTPPQSRASVFHYLKGVRVPNKEALAKISSKLGIPVEEIRKSCSLTR